MTERVLVVEDSPDNRELARTALEIGGYEVRTAADADEAIAAVRETAFDIILMDVQLPRMSGLELTKRFKSDPETRSIPVVALTAYAMKRDAREALDAGCDAYMAKPYSIDDLLETIRRTLDERTAPP